jgi:hypothetical protein
MGPRISSTLPMAVFNEISSWKFLGRNYGSSHLILEIDGGIEVWYFRIDRLADDFTFAGVKEGTHF